MKNNSVFISKIALLLNVFLSVTVAIGAMPESKTIFEITNVRLDKKSFNPSKGGKVTLDFEITRRADVKVIIYDYLGREIRNFDVRNIESGKHSVTWDGRRINGQFAEGAVFLYIIEAEDKNGQKALYNKAKETGGFRIEPVEFTVDGDTGKIEYVLPKACMVRLHAGLKDGMLANSIFDWQPHTAGRHNYNWDGKDESGIMSILKNPDLNVSLVYYTLPENTIIKSGVVVPFESDGGLTKEQKQKRDNLWATGGKYWHYRHDPIICHKLRFKMFFPEAAEIDNEDIPLVSGTTSLRVELDERDIEHLMNTRFEIMIYVDGVFIHETEEGSSPFTYSWDTTILEKGSHIVTINILSYDNHFGVVSRKVIVGD